MTDEETEAVELTRKLVGAGTVSSSVQSACARARMAGHALVSQGCAIFRCVKCNLSGYAGRGMHHDAAWGKKCDV